MPINIYTLCEYQEFPLGIQNKNPRFSWRLEGDMHIPSQVAYRLIVSENNGQQIWNSGEVKSDRSTCVRYMGPELKEKTGYIWYVTVVCEDGKFYSSKPAFFETAIFSEDTWKGQWIGVENHEYGKAPRFRKTFSLPQCAASARLYISGLGYYIAYINGKRIGDRQLEPGMTDYRKRVLYSVYDVKPYLKSGDNVLAVELGEGWYGHQHPCMDLFIGHQPFWHDQPKLRYDLDITLEDGTTCCIASSVDSDRCGKGPIVENGIYDGETYDARLEQPFWNSSVEEPEGYAPAISVTEPGGIMVAQQIPSIRCVQELSVICEKNSDTGSTLYDFGQNIAGWVKIRCHGPAGSSVKLLYAEVEADGHVNQKNLRGAKSTDTYILSGTGEEYYKPSFTYHGFRFTEAICHGGAVIDEITAQVVRSAVETTGHFVSDNKLLNQIQTASVWTEWNNMHSVPTDCPQRDERQAWLNDMTVRCYAAAYNFNIPLFYEKWMDDIADIQTTEGAIPDTAPWIYGGIPAYHVSSVFVLIPWLMYLQYGDDTIMERLYPALKRYVFYKLSLRGEDGIIGEPFYGDWAAPSEDCIIGSSCDALPKHISAGLISTGYLYADCLWMKKIAMTLGYTEDVSQYEQLSQEVKHDLNNRYHDGNGMYDNGSQGNQIMPLFLGIVPEEQEQAAYRILIDNIADRGYHLTTGNQTTKLLFDVFSHYNDNKIAFQVATVKGYPGFDYMFENGATTIWERWQYLDGEGMNSHDHPMMSSFTDWFYRELGGIHRDKCLCEETLEISPDITVPLGFVETSCLCGKGTITCNWKKESKGILLQVTIPWNAQGVVALKSFVADMQGFQYAEDYVTCALSSGKHTLFFDGKKFEIKK